MGEIDEKIGQETLDSVRANTIRLLNEKGPKLDRVLLRLRQALSAKETKFFQFQGIVTDQREVIAHNIRLAAAKLTLELHDAMPNQKHEFLGADGKDLDWRIEIVDPKEKKSEK